MFLIEITRNIIRQKIIKSMYFEKNMFYQFQNILSIYTSIIQDSSIEPIDINVSSDLHSYGNLANTVVSDEKKCILHNYGSIAQINLGFFGVGWVKQSLDNLKSLLSPTLISNIPLMYEKCQGQGRKLVCAVARSRHQGHTQFSRHIEFEASLRRGQHLPSSVGQQNLKF